MQYQLDQLAYHHAHPDGLESLLSHRAPKFDSARQFGAFAKIVFAQAEDGASGPSGCASPTAMVMEMLAYGCWVDSSPRAFTPSPVPYHEGWVKDVIRAAEQDAGDIPLRAWLLADVRGEASRRVAEQLRVSKAVALELADAGRLAVERVLIEGRYLRQ